MINKSLLAVTLLLSILFLVSADTIAQKVRLRSQILPNCGSSSNLKFADIYAEGNTAVMGSYNCRGAFIFNIANPDAPTLANWYNPIRTGTASTTEQFLEAIVVNNRGYFGSGNGGGVYIVDLSNPASPQLLGVVNSSNGNAFNSIHEMVVFEQNGATYLIENFNGFSNKLLKVINVTNPATPVFIRDINPTETSWVHAMHIRGNRMFTSGWGTSTTRGRTEIYDISNIGTQTPALLGFVEDPNASVTNGNSMHSSWTSEDGNYLYSAREVGGSAANGPSPGDVRVYNVSNPATPLLVNKVTMNDLGLNAVTPHNPVVKGNKLYVSWYQAGLQVFDISDPATLTRIGQYDTYQPAFFEPAETKTGTLAGEPWDIVCGSVNLQNSVPTGYDGAWAVFPFLGDDRILIGDLASGLYIVDVRQSTSPGKNVVSDFDGDRRTDTAVFTPSSGSWLIEQSSDNALTGTQWGIAEDRVVPGDYDGDGRSDVAIWRPSSGVWWINGSSTGLRVVQFGLNGDEPVAADYDADGRTDIAVWRPSTGVWYVLQSSLGLRILQWGINGDKPISGDFEGDGKADIGVWRPSSGVWYVLPSSSSIPMILQWGTNGDKPVFGDFTGDGKADYAIFRPTDGHWYILGSTGSLHAIQQFGLAEDVPVPGDYDGDGKADVSVFRPSTNVWYRINSSDGSVWIRQFGITGDRPTPSSVNPQ